MKKRKSLSKTTRFEVFKRDSFTCQYCGAKAPDRVLVVDHVRPVADGGDNDLLNLVTSCEVCNQGKGARKLDDASVVEKQRRQLDELQDRREQIDMLLDWKRGLSSIDDHAAQRAAEFWTEKTFGWGLNETGMHDLRKLLRKFPLAEVLESIEAATDQYLDFRDDKATKESVNKAWVYVEKIARMRKAQEEKPYLRDLFWCRAVARRNSGYFDDRCAIDLLESAYDKGASIDELKRIARATRNWSSWRDDMNDYIDELDKKGSDR